MLIKRTLLIGLLALAILTGIVILIFTLPTSKAEAYLPEATLDVLEKLQSISVSTGEIKYDSSMENEAGEEIVIWKDDKYRYYMNAEKTEVVTFVLNTEQMDRLVIALADKGYDIDYEKRAKSYISALSKNPISGEIDLTQQKNPENPLEYVTFTIHQKVGNVFSTRGI